MSALELDSIVKSFGSVQAVRGISFTAQLGEWTAIVGPSGCGKTTTLRVIAGLERPDAGRVVLRGSDVTKSRPYERDIGLVFQDYSLFPHMTVERNVAFGLRQRGLDATSITKKSRAALELVHLRGYERRWPSQLSGGEQQRVALARSLVTEPAVLLLDEPLSNLDAKLRREMRSELRTILEQVETVPLIVTHDQEEALGLGEQIIVMEGGAIAQTGSTSEIYEAPSTRFVADFIGAMNWLSGEYERHVDNGHWLFRTREGAPIVVRQPGDGSGSGYDIGIRPERVHVGEDVENTSVGAVRSGAGQAINRLEGLVERVDIIADNIDVVVRLDSGIQLHATDKNRGLLRSEVGSRTIVAFSADDCIPIKLEEGR